ncbi:MAG: GYD domain-containing protein [Candidatus Omnitrophica bacterium]|nr:GYD domain-containing protein [Candidatus Omnitrophota bacterium]
MAHYVILANFTDQGIRSIKETGKRAKAFRDLAKQMGVTINDIFWTMGRYDVVVTAEAPKDETVASLMMKMGAIGNLKSETLRAFGESEIEALTSKI